MSACSRTLNYVIVGPPGAGKSTASALLSQKLRLPLKSMDADRSTIAGRYGYSVARAERIYTTLGAEGYTRYVTKFDAVLLAKWLNEEPAVIDTSGGIISQIHTLRTQHANCSAIWVLIRPPIESERFWRERITQRDPNDPWWHRGGDNVQRAAIKAAASLAAEPGIRVLAGPADMTEVLGL